MEFIEAVQQYHANGFLPVLLDDGSKKAAFRNWNTRPMDVHEIISHLRRRRYNVGLLMRGVVVIDVDDPSAMDWVDHNGLRSAMEVTTWSGKLHVYLRAEDEGPTRIRFGGMPLDIKRTGYVVAPPSIIDGKAYRFAEGKGIVPASDLPSFPSRLLTPERPAPSPLDLPDDRKLEAMRRWIRCKIARSGEGGDAVTFKVALKIVSVVADFHAAMAEILAWDRECAVPPWSDTPQGVVALEHKIRSALNYQR